MRSAIYAFGALWALILSLSANSQECPLHFGEYISEVATQICSRVKSFNDRRVPGIVAADSDNDDNDDCDDADPTWLPTPPYSALVFIGKRGVSITKIDEDTKWRLDDAIGSWIDPHDGYNYRGTIIPRLSEHSWASEPFLIPEELHELMMSKNWYATALDEGNMVYYYMHDDKDD